jgi:hypothetical protein
VTTISDAPDQKIPILTLWWGLLDNDTDNLSVVNDDSTSLESGSTKEIMSVKDEAGSGTESTSVVSNYNVSSVPIDS